MDESPVPDEDAATLCFDVVVSVPHFGGGVLHCNMVTGLKI